MILDNTFIAEAWYEIASQGFIKLPMLIIEFDLDGLIFLIVMKILFAIIVILAALGTALLATLWCMIFSPISYPIGLKRIKTADFKDLGK